MVAQKVSRVQTLVLPHPHLGLIFVWVKYVSSISVSNLFCINKKNERNELLAYTATKFSEYSFLQ